MSTRIQLAICAAAFSVSPAAAGETAGASRIKFLNYPGCIELRNGVGTVVVLGHHVGGRVLSYRQGDFESLYINEKSELEWQPDGDKRPSSAGRFDIGPEYLIPKRSELWSGEYASEITGPRSARLTSQPAPDAGIRIIREFTLDQDSSSLACKQIIENTSEETQSWCHWGRMFAITGGIGVVPLTPEHRRFPEGYIMMRGRNDMWIAPEDPMVRRRGDFLEILGPPAHAKLGFDTFAGWHAYQMPGDIAFIKTYYADPTKLYGEVAGLTLSIWYPKPGIPACELEPISPMMTVEPGGRASFTEHWHLVANPFPDEGERLDLEALAATAAALKKNTGTER